MDNEVMELIDQLYTMVSEAWGVPLGNEKCIVERDQVLEILDEIKTAMPVELSEAKRLVSARDEFINNAKREAEGIRNQAEERARALVNDQEIVRIAKARSNEMLASTQAKADALRQASSQFCVDALRRTEEAISAALPPSLFATTNGDWLFAFTSLRQSANGGGMGIKRLIHSPANRTFHVNRVQPKHLPSIKIICFREPLLRDELHLEPRSSSVL